MCQFIFLHDLWTIGRKSGNAKYGRNWGSRFSDRNVNAPVLYSHSSWMIWWHFYHVHWLFLNGPASWHISAVAFDKYCSSTFNLHTGFIERTWDCLKQRLDTFLEKFYVDVTVLLNNAVPLLVHLMLTLCASSLTEESQFTKRMI